MASFLSRFHVSLLVAAGMCASARAQPAAPDPWDACAPSAASAEQEGGIPAGLLLAIGKVESGRVNPGTGRVVPWPFALNIEGRGLYPASAEAAKAEVRAAQAAGMRSIDVGCFQISLLHHPQAFATLDEAFDPARNAAYAARFLASLRARLPSWEQAAGGYHSLTPAFGEPYAARVMASWSGSGAAAASPGLVRPELVRMVSFRAAIPPTIQVYVPGGQASTWPSMSQIGRVRLPVVYGPARK